jgi:hypothetical protein
MHASNSGSSQTFMVSLVCGVDTKPQNYESPASPPATAVGGTCLLPSVSSVNQFFVGVAGAAAGVAAAGLKN